MAESNASTTNPVAAAARTIYAETVLAELPKLTHAIAGFTSDLSAETAKPGTTIDADFAKVSTVQETFPGYTKYTGADGAVKLTLDLDLSAGFTIDEAKLMSRGANYISEAARLNVSAVLNKLLSKIVEVATGTKVTQILQLAKDAPYDAAALKATFAKLLAVGIDPAWATLVLSGADYAELATSLPYNMVGKVDNALNTGVIGSALGLKAITVAPTLASNGFVSAPTGVVVAARAIPSTSSGNNAGFRRQYIKDPVTGLTLTMTEAFNTDTGATTFSVRTIAGAAVLDPKAIVKITRAAA